MNLTWMRCGYPCEANRQLRILALKELIPLSVYSRDGFYPRFKNNKKLRGRRWMGVWERVNTRQMSYRTPATAGTGPRANRLTA